MPRILCLTFFFCSTIVSASDQAAKLTRATDIIASWRPDQHLYVKGDVGVPAGRLDNLERWLGDKGKNWVVILLQDAAGERYERSTGVDAVETAANVGLRNQTGFGQLEDSRSGETNGAIFILFLAERTFSYSGGETHDTRGLGSRSWKGNLDRPAFRAMSNGRRIVDAVEVTVKEVDRRLTRQFKLEQERRQREIAAAQRARENAGQALTEGEGDIAALETAARDFKEANPDATGDLANPPIAGLKEQLAAAKTSFQTNDVRGALSGATQVREFSAAHIRALQNHASAPEAFDALAAGLSEVLTRDSQWAGERLDLVREQLRLAEAAHANASSEYLVHFQNAGEALDSAKAEIANQRRLELQREKQRRAVRTLAITCAFLIAAGMLAVAVRLNRKRRSVMEQAVELFQNWTRGAAEQTSELFALLDRTSLVVGSAANLEKRGYTGETLKLGKQAIEDVDELFIMSSCVRRVLNDVEELLHPANPLVQGLNLVSADRYERSLSHLRDEPIRFRPEEGIEPILREERGEPERMLGKLEAHQPFELSFLELIEACNQHVTRATEALDGVEEGWAQISSTLEGLQNDLDTLTEHERNLASAAEEDGFFRVPALFDELIPAAQTDIDHAVKTGASDPVGALQGPATAARRIIDDGISLAQTILTAREQRFPEMRVRTRQLRAAEVRTGWVTRFLDEFSADANSIAGAACCEPVSESIAELVADLKRHDERIERALRLSARVHEAQAEQIETVSQAISANRKSIGRKLDVVAKEVLAEDALNPDDRLAEATRQHAAARVALDRGGVDAAKAALDAVRELTDDALGLIAVSRQSLEMHAEQTRQRQDEDSRLADSIPEAAELLKDLQKRYLPPALQLDRKNLETTLNDNISDAGKALSEARALIKDSGKNFARARLIEAAVELEHAANLQLQTEQMLDEIEGHAGSLEKTGSENVHDLARLDGRLETISAQADDPRTMAPSGKKFEAARQELQAIHEANEVEIRDPYEISDRLAALTESLANLADRIQSDWKLHEEVVRSLGAAHSQLASALELARRSETDLIPDSPQILSLRKETRELSTALDAAEPRREAAHGDWENLDIDADRIHAAAGRVAAAFREELERAEDSVRAISDAAAQVRAATAWSGSQGVSILGSPGANTLAQARRGLLRGSYIAAQRLAEDAGNQARHAITAAVAEVARRRRAEQRRQEEARRLAAAAVAARRRSMSSSTSTFGGGGFSSGGGMGSSSFGGGSGMGRSGW